MISVVIQIYDGTSSGVAHMYSFFCSFIVMILFKKGKKSDAHYWIVQKKNLPKKFTKENECSPYKIVDEVVDKTAIAVYIYSYAIHTTSNSNELLRATSMAIILGRSIVFQTL